MPLCAIGVALVASPIGIGRRLAGLAPLLAVPLPIIRRIPLAAVLLRRRIARAIGWVRRILARVSLPIRGIRRIGRPWRRWIARPIGWVRRVATLRIPRDLLILLVLLVSSPALAPLVRLVGLPSWLALRRLVGLTTRT